MINKIYIILNMKIQILLWMALVCLNNCQQQYVYTIHYVKSYRSDLLQKNVGCHLSNVAYSTYIHPTGALDAMYFMINPGTYNARINCQGSRNTYGKVFGTAQNYEELIRSDPQAVANKVFQTVSRAMSKIIVDWKYPLANNLEQSRTWLNKFIQVLQRQIDTYLKAPASYFCHTNEGKKYLLDLDKPKKFIIQAYGQQVGAYTTFEQLFEKQVSRTIKDADKYPDTTCAKFPSYLTLKSQYASKEFFIQKTLLKEQAGYIGSKFGEYLEKAKDIYGKVAFLDSYQGQIIQL